LRRASRGPVDLPLVFSRFYRSASARDIPGAGLGLAIVRQITDARAGSVTAEPAPDGGTIVRLRPSEDVRAIFWSHALTFRRWSLTGH
jgi:signal transduction histidine kinase